MRILYIANTIIPSKHASSVHVMKMCNALTHEGGEVNLVTTQGDMTTDVFEQYNTSTKFKISWSKNKKKLGFLFRLLEAFKNIQSQDIILTRWLLAAVFLPLKFKKTIIYEFHSEPYGLLQNILFRIHLFNNSKFKYIFITHALKKYYMDKYPSLIEKESIVLPDGADPILDSKVKKLSNPISCCYIGSFIEGKGVDTVVKIANSLPEIQFQIVGGDSEEVEKLRVRSINNNIVWHGFKTQSEAMKILEESHIALLPNKFQVILKGNKDIGKWTSPLKLFEYMSFAKAIVASDIPVLKEVLVDHKNSILVEPESIDDWVESIRYLISNENLYQEISTNAKNELEQKYSWNKRAQRILNW